MNKSKSAKIPEKLPFGARIDLAVSYDEKSEASKLGACWDAKKKCWYTKTSLSSHEELLRKFKVNDKRIEILTGEAKYFGGNLLYVDLIPQNCWFTNVRYCVHVKDWDRLRDYVYRRVNYICETCKLDTKQSSTQLEAHERWEYNTKTSTQILKRLVALCHECHQATHMGLAQVRGKGDIAKKHLSTVRHFTDFQADNHIEMAFELWNYRNNFNWKLDLSLITSNNIKLATNVGVNDRRSIAEIELIKQQNSRIDEIECFGNDDFEFDEDQLLN